MSLMEQKKKIDERILKLEQWMKERYEIAFEVRNKKYFKTENGEIFKLTRMAWANAVVVEYAENYEEALISRFEDGDVFYMDEFDESAMYNAIIREIEDI